MGLDLVGCFGVLCFFLAEFWAVSYAGFGLAAVVFWFLWGCWLFDSAACLWFAFAAVECLLRLGWFVVWFQGLSFQSAFVLGFGVCC